MSNPGDFAYTVKQQADIVRVIGDYVKLKKTGAQNFSGLCPFHKEKSPSFSVHATRQFFHCFGCGASGDVFSFVQKQENITFPEAVRLVAQKVGIELPKATYSGPAEAKEAKLRGQLLDMHERACAFFEEMLRRPEGAAAREYLAGRGLNDDMLRAFRMGFAPDSGFLLRDRLKSGFDEETLKASGLFSWKEEAEGRSAAMYSKFRNRVTFPITNESGKIIAFTGRTLATDDKTGPKYLNSPETAIYSKSRVLFNLDKAKEAIRKLDYAILVEGQMDCISVYAAGFHNVIASSGTAFTEPQVRLLARFSKNIIVSFDPDTAGAAAAERSLALLVEEEFNIKVAQLEPGFDPDLLIRRKGREAYAAVLKSAQKYFEYLIARAQAQFPTRTPEGKQKAVNFLLPHIHRIPSRIVRDELAGEIAHKLGIDSAVLRQELKHAAATRSATMRSLPATPVTHAERIFIVALISGHGIDDAPELRRQAHYTLANQGLHKGLASESLLDALLAADADEPPDPAALALSDSDRRLMAEVLMGDAEVLTAELLEGATEALRRRHLERQQQQLRVEIADAERRNDSARLSQLLTEKQKVDRALATH
jgi:DNA primase